MLMITSPVTWNLIFSTSRGWHTALVMAPLTAPAIAYCVADNGVVWAGLKPTMSCETMQHSPHHHHKCPWSTRIRTIVKLCQKQLIISYVESFLIINKFQDFTDGWWNHTMSKRHQMTHFGNNNSWLGGNIFTQEKWHWIFIYYYHINLYQIMR